MAISKDNPPMSLTLRKQHTKRRSGCRTCKIRRVKCDETFPACLKCLRLGQVCDGYGIWGGGGTAFSDPTIWSQTDTPVTLLKSTHHLRSGPTSAPRLRISSEEQYYLDWFLHGTAVTPPRIFKSSFWEPAILQATAHEPMILQAILALSAAHKRHVHDPINRVRDGVAPDALEIFILKHYGRAIRGLQNHLDGSGDVTKINWFPAVTMCALLVLISLMRGRFEEACMHLNTGAQIAKQSAHSADQPCLSPILAQFFVRLQDQTTLFRRHASSLRAYKLRPSTSAVAELRFNSPAEAGHYLDDLTEQVAHLAQQVRSMPQSATEALAIQHDTCRYLLSCFDSWLNSYNATTEERRLCLTPSDAAAYEALRQRYDVSRTIAERCIGSIVPVEVEEL